MRAATYIYIGLYVLSAAWVIASDIKAKDPLWDTAADAFLLPLGFLGMLLFQMEVTNPPVKALWKVASVLIVAGQVFTNVFSRHLTLKGGAGPDPRDIPQWAILASDLAVIVVLLPMFIMNGLFAFS